MVKKCFSNLHKDSWRFMQIMFISSSLLFFASPSFAQTTVVKGTVTAASDGSPLVGVNVVQSGNPTNGVVTDLDGKYQITVKTGSDLDFSFMGYLSQSHPAKSVLNVVLEEDSKTLDEVVVVGYGTMKKSDISGSVVSVSNETMMKKVPTNLAQGLKGVAPGVMISSQDGAPDGNAAISIRGVATINGSAKPLYVVDGVQVGTDANFINPSDVESIEILKDASATAIYGSAGANGVIMITTKHGKAGVTHIDVSVNFGLSTLANKLDVCSLDQYAANIRAARANDGDALANKIWTEQYDGKRNVIDWQDELTRTGVQQQYNISVSGGAKNTQSLLSIGYLKNEGLIVNSFYDRLTARINAKTKVADFIEMGGDMSFVHVEANGSNSGFNNAGNISSLRDLAYLCPTMDYVDTDGKYVSPNLVNTDGTYGDVMQGTNVNDCTNGVVGNLYARQMENDADNRNNRTLANAYVDINIIKGLNFKSIVSYNFYSTDYSNFAGNARRYNFKDGQMYELARVGYDYDYVFDLNQSQGNTIAIENFLTYNYKTDLQSLTLMAGQSASKYDGKWVSSHGKDFPSNARAQTLSYDMSANTGNGEYNLQIRNTSYFGRLIYSFKDRYIVTGTVRRDGSSNFGEGNRWGVFPSAALAWRVSEESFLKGNDIINNLKLRLGWGQTGNSGGATDRATPSLSTDQVKYQFYPAPESTAGPYGGNAIFVTGYKVSLVDPKLKWETNEQTNVGLDIGLFNNSINITADYFIRKSKDLLLERAIRPSAGYASIYTNYGEIENKGIEVSINWQKRINDWSFSTTFTGSSLKNKVNKMGEDIYNTNTNPSGDGSNQGAVGDPSGYHWGNHSICREGYAVGSFYGYQVEKIFDSQAEIDALDDAAKALKIDGVTGYNGVAKGNTKVGDFKFRDVNGDGYVDGKDMTILGDGFPKFNYGININVGWKDVDFSIYGHGVAGQDIYSYSAMRLSNVYYSGDDNNFPNILSENVGRIWSPTNQSGDLSRLSYTDKNYNMRASDKWVLKGDFFKISNIQIGYTFNEKWLNPLRLSTARIYFAIQNVACFSSYNKYGDPECGQGNVLYTGLDTGRYPNPRIYQFGLNMQF